MPRLRGYPRSNLICLISLVCLIAFAPRVTAQDQRNPDDQPLKSGEHTVELNGMKLWYKVSGAGPVCLMPSPAWGASSELYIRTLTSMEKRFTLVYVDSRGTGRSGRAGADQYTWDLLIGDLDALRAHLKLEQLWLMGHSEGGMQAIYYACRHPERVRGLVLLSTAAADDKASYEDTLRRLSWRQKEPWFADATNALFTLGEVTSDEEFAERIKKILPLYWSDPGKLNQYADDFAARKVSAAGMQGQRASKRFPCNWIPELKTVKAPALIVVGDDDFICSPVQAMRMHVAMPNSKLLLIERCGHFPWLEQPQVFEKQVPEFLAAMGLPTK